MRSQVSRSESTDRHDWSEVISIADRLLKCLGGIPWDNIGQVEHMETSGTNAGSKQRRDNGDRLSKSYKRHLVRHRESIGQSRPMQKISEQASAFIFLFCLPSSINTRLR